MTPAARRAAIDGLPARRRLNFPAYPIIMTVCRTVLTRRGVANRQLPLFNFLAPFTTLSAVALPSVGYIHRDVMIRAQWDVSLCCTKP